MCVYRHPYVTECMWRLEASPQEETVPFDHVNPGDLSCLAARAFSCWAVLLAYCWAVKKRISLMRSYVYGVYEKHTHSAKIVPRKVRSIYTPVDDKRMFIFQTSSRFLEVCIQTCLSEWFVAEVFATRLFKYVHCYQWIILAYGELLSRIKTSNWKVWFFSPLNHKILFMPPTLYCFNNYVWFVYSTMLGAEKTI